MAKLLIPGLRAYTVDQRFFAGSYPGGATEDRSHDTLNALWRHGVSVFISLMEEDEHLRYGQLPQDYDAFFPDVDDTKQAAPQMLRFPIRDMAVPDRSFLKQILDVIDAQLEQGRGVYLHCLGGVGRTGTVVGCWLARHGIAQGEPALHEINRLREYDPMLDLPSPQTEAQRRMVQSWSPGE